MKKAFTMIELIFVIVVMGILAATILPSTRTNPLQEAAIQIVSHIRYTQHLAMVDDKFDASDANWYKQRWQLVFSKSDFTGNVPAYTIFSDIAGESTGDAQESEIALNPENINQIMTGGYGNAQAIDYKHVNFKGMKRLNLGNSYGVENIDLDEGCSGARIVFDYLGRPMKGDLSGNASAYEDDNLIQSQCRITLTSSTDILVIAIEPETGFTCILDSSSNCI